MALKIKQSTRPRPATRRSPTQALAVLAAHRRDVILEAVATSARELLRSQDLSQSLPKVIEQIGLATGVDHAHLFEIERSGDGRILSHYIWSAPGLTPPPDLSDVTEFSMVDRGLASWMPALAKGEIVVGHARSFEGAVRRFLDNVGIKSIMAVPVFVENLWWGHLGYDACRDEREWTSTEIDTLKTLAELVGAAVARARSLKHLADANRIIENSPTILFRLGPHEPFPLTYVSDNSSRYGFDADALLTSPKHWLELVDSDDRPTLMTALRSIATGTTDRAKTEFWLKKPDDSKAFFEGEGRALRDGNGRLIAIEGILTDTTERKRSEGWLSFSHILLTTAIESSPDAILIVDAGNRIVKFNHRFVELWGIARELVAAGADEPVLKTVASWMKNQGEFVARVRYLYDHPDIQSHEELELKDGRIVDRHSGSLFDAQRKYLGRIWFFRDITDNKRAVQKIAALARTDVVSGLPNRTAFLERLQLALARARRGSTRFAVLYLDLDHFKDINDTLGHAAGDALLQAVAERLKGAIRETDMVARFGGDEFAVLQEDVSDLANIELLASKIGRILAAPYWLNENKVHTTASIGIVPYCEGVETPEAMLMKADLALYRAKDEGRNRYRFHEAELDQEVRERVMIGEALHLAIERHEFELFYQPQVELKSGRIVGLEALIRWNHPTRGLVLPATFIPIAETTGSILPIGQWVIERACRQFGVWRDQGIAVPVMAVNLSAAQFKLASGLDLTILDGLSKNRISPSQLELELTESVLMETTQRYNEAFKRLRALGVRLAIDDFGTGYSSLDYLRSFHVSRLKIDRRFVEGVMTNPDDATIVRATIGLAHALGIEAIAEGVETAEQRAFLIAAGCKCAQGNLFGEAMPVDRVAELLRSRLPSGAREAGRATAAGSA